MNDKKDKRRQLSIAVLCMRYLHINQFVTDSENDKIFNRIRKFQDKNEIDISEAQLDSANLTYNDRAK